MMPHPIKSLVACLLTAFLFTALTVEAAPKRNATTKTLSTAALASTTQVQYLSGTGPDDAVSWDFFCTDGRKSGTWTTIPVPSCWELQGFGTYQYGMPFYGKANPPGIAAEQGKYRHTFYLPAEWQGRIIRLVFEGAMTDCSATINGRRAVALHQGGFYRFKADVTDRVFFGKKANTLEVTVSKESANPQVNLAERRADYWNFGGLFRPVFVEALPPVHIDRIALDAMADGAFKAVLFMGAASDEPLSAEAVLVDEIGKLVSKPLTTTLRSGSDQLSLEGRFEGVEAWSAENPRLYHLRLRLMNDQRVLHEVTERIGFRTVRFVPGDGFYLNGTKVLFKGVNRHSFRPATGRCLSKDDNYADVRLIKSMNMNAVRLSHYPPDPAFLDACDELGLYVMNELGGWHGKYDTETGCKLVKSLVTRDANHASVIWWSNGNEGGWNTELDTEFAKWDVQNRPVLHPQGELGGVETMHYRSYGESQEYMRKPTVFMPTEFLHGLYDGGLGAGLFDYWEMMRNHPRCAGGFLWVLADEGVVRTDQDGRIDNCGNYGADGIVGPQHEKEGSYYTIREVWSPVQVKPSAAKQPATTPLSALQSLSASTALPADFDGRLSVENRYAFTNLDQCRFNYAWIRFPNRLTADNESTVLQSGSLQGPAVAPGANGTLRVPLSSDPKVADALQLSVVDPHGQTLFTWIWAVEKRGISNASSASPAVPKTGTHPLHVERSANECLVKAGTLNLRFNTATGRLNGVERAGKPLSLSNGPRFVGARRADRSMDQFYNHDDAQAKSKDRQYKALVDEGQLVDFTLTESTDTVVLTATYSGLLSKVVWTIISDGRVCLDYTYRYDGVVELMGIAFDYPEGNMQGKRWLGKGPYRVWQNRLHGPTLGVWQNDYNDPVPAESFTYPEFKGFFADWQWATFQTNEGSFSLINETPDAYLGVYTPRDGRDGLLYTFSELGLSVLQVIPAVRNKVNATDLVGPSSQPQWVRGDQQGRIWLDLTR